MMLKNCHERYDRHRKGIVAAFAAGLLTLSACHLPDNLWVNVISSGALTATNVLISALANRTAEQLFGTTGSAGGGVSLANGAGGDHAP